jgi:hypothetical protein
MPGQWAKQRAEILEALTYLHAANKSYRAGPFGNSSWRKTEPVAIRGSRRG